MKTVDVADMATELTLAIERCQAVAQSFSDEYIDCDDKEIYTAVMMRTEHYCRLFDVISVQIDEIRKQAAALEGTINSLCKS